MTTDSHTVKAIRALLYFAQEYANLGPGALPGIVPGKCPNIPGLDTADGSVFVRAAGVIMGVKGWSREGEAEGVWARNPLGYDEVWEDEPVGWTLQELDAHRDSAYAVKKG